MTFFQIKSSQHLSNPFKTSDGMELALFSSRELAVPRVFGPGRHKWTNCKWLTLEERTTKPAVLQEHY